MLQLFCNLFAVYDLNPKTFLFKLGKGDEKFFLLMESGIRVHLTKYSRAKTDMPNGTEIGLLGWSICAPQPVQNRSIEVFTLFDAFSQFLNRFLHEVTQTHSHQIASRCPTNGNGSCGHFYIRNGRGMSSSILFPLSIVYTLLAFIFNTPPSLPNTHNNNNNNNTEQSLVDSTPTTSFSNYMRVAT
jgi:hypothetical protein